MDGGLNQNMSPKSFAAPNLTPMDFPSLSQEGDGLQQQKDNMFFFKSGSIDYVSAVKKLASPDSGMWKYEREDSADSSIGSSRNSHALAGAYNKLQNRAPSRPAPVWLETGDAVGKFPLFSLVILAIQALNILVMNREYVFQISRGST